MLHSENCECCRCQQIPQKPYEEGSYNTAPVVQYDPSVYHLYCQSPCARCGRIHFQQSTNINGTLPLKYEYPNMSMCSPSHVSADTTISPNNELQRTNSTKFSKPRISAIDKRNGLDKDDEGCKKNFTMQTCKDTAVGDCPAGFSSKTNFHEKLCQLCCEMKVCGPNYRNCPFNQGKEIQTDPICDLMGIACKCENPQEEPSGVGANSEFTSIECRCIDKSCNTSKHCFIVDDKCAFTKKDCKCSTKDCDVNQSRVFNEDYRDPYICPQFENCISYYDSSKDEPANQSFNPNNTIRRCHACSQTNNASVSEQPILTQQKRVCLNQSKVTKSSGMKLNQMVQCSKCQRIGRSSQMPQCSIYQNKTQSNYTSSKPSKYQTKTARSSNKTSAFQNKERSDVTPSSIRGTYENSSTTATGATRRNCDIRCSTFTQPEKFSKSLYTNPRSDNGYYCTDTATTQKNRYCSPNSCHDKNISNNSKPNLKPSVIDNSNDRTSHPYPNLNSASDTGRRYNTLSRELQAPETAGITTTQYISKDGTPELQNFEVTFEEIPIVNGEPRSQISTNFVSNVLLSFNINITDTNYHSKIMLKRSDRA
ncbi:hypothetical protein ABEB36_009751 [Hypothenemus hampei]|uniref:Uncharacterized protein n=1 Tax=Hypothenemus hampei TaxID=57062 RepID=A0ABD1EHC1_HYPHA